MNDLLNSLKAYLYDRASSPLFGAFVTSWCLWNWQVLLLLFSNMEVERKIFVIETQIYADKDILINYCFYYPFFSSIGVLLLYPLPSIIVYAYWRWQQNLLKKIQLKIDSEAPISKEEAAALKLEIYKTQETHEKELEMLYEKIKYLETTNKGLNKTADPALTYPATVQPMPIIPESTQEEYYKEIKEILTKIAESDNKITLEKILENKEFYETLRYKNIIQVLKDRNCIAERVNDETSRPALAILNDGIKVLLSMRTEGEDESRN